MRDAVDAAVNAGVTVVVAGGNSNSDACNFSPAFVPSAITVGSTTSLDERSSFSNYGSCTDIWAPGSSVKSAAHTSDTGSSTLSGTSMAPPCRWWCCNRSVGESTDESLCRRAGVARQSILECAQGLEGG